MNLHKIQWRDAEDISVLAAILKKAGLAPKKHVMVNKVSAGLRECLTETCKLQLVPPGCHRRNVTKVVIKTLKKYFISILAELPDSLPMRLWCELLIQAELTCNILCAFHARPGISAHAYMNGPLNFDHVPLPPLGCKAQCHEKTANCGQSTVRMAGVLALVFSTIVLSMHSPLLDSLSPILGIHCVAGLSTHHK